MKRARHIKRRPKHDPKVKAAWRRAYMRHWMRQTHSGFSLEETRILGFSLEPLDPKAQLLFFAKTKAGVLSRLWLHKGKTPKQLGLKVVRVEVALRYKETYQPKEKV